MVNVIVAWMGVENQDMVRWWRLEGYLDLDCRDNGEDGGPYPLRKRRVRRGIPFTDYILKNGAGFVSRHLHEAALFSTQ